jgi:hypothetical protein
MQIVSKASCSRLLLLDISPKRSNARAHYVVLDFRSSSFSVSISSVSEEKIFLQHDGKPQQSSTKAHSTDGSTTRSTSHF